MSYFKKQQFIIFSLLLMSCSKTIYNNENLHGTYRYKNSLVISNIILNKDFSFEYDHYSESSHSESKGVWSYYNKQIILSSFDEFLTDTIVVKEFSINETKDLKIKINDFYLNRPCDYVILKIDDLEFEPNKQGEVIVPEGKKFSAFIVSSLRKEYRYEIKNSNSNFFNIDFFENGEYEHFKNKKFPIKNKKIYRNNTLIYQKE